MKKYLAIVLLLFIAFQSFAQKDPEDVNVTIRSGEINLGKKNNIADNWNVQDGIAYLGKDERVRDGYNKTHTYDKMGLVLFESMVDKKPSGKISELQVHFSLPEEPNEVAPKAGFTGTLKIEKLTITSYLTFETVKSELNDYAETEAYIEHSHRLAKDGLYIYFQYDKTDTKLVKVSVGQDKRNK